MNRLLASLAIALAFNTVGPVAQARQAPQPSPRSLVVNLYRDFAWVPLFATDPTLKGPQWEGVSQQSESVLRGYFAPDLARLLVADRQCAARSQGVCNLDFDPIFNAQDSSGASDLAVSPGAPGQVIVSIRYPSDPKPMKLIFAMRQTPSGWRIADIRYPDGSSLLKLLSAR